MSGNDNFTKILLHLDGANLSTTITDSQVGGAPHTWTAHTGTISTTQSKFGGASFICATTGWADTPDSADFTLGSSDFTIDFWFYRTGSQGTGAQRLFGQDSAAGTDRSISGTLTTTSNTISAQYTQDGTTAPSLVGVTTTTLSAWHHYALVRSGTTLSIYLDGTLENSTTVTGALWDSSSAFAIGEIGARTGGIFDGFIDEFRLSVGIARWTSNFTPASVAYSVDWMLWPIPPDYAKPKKAYSAPPAFDPRVMPAVGVSGVAWTQPLDYAKPRKAQSIAQAMPPQGAASVAAKNLGFWAQPVYLRRPHLYAFTDPIGATFGPIWVATPPAEFTGTRRPLYRRGAGTYWKG